MEYSRNWTNTFRYAPEISVRQKTFGDLANLTCFQGVKQERFVTFTTDQYGYRNERNWKNKEISFVALGDSFGVGNGTTQSKTWVSLLSERSSRTAYNLSFPSSPRDQVDALEREISRLPLSTKTTIFWLIFEGNDMTDLSSKNASVVRPLRLYEKLLVRIRNYQIKSPIHLLVKSFFFQCKPDGRVEKRTLPHLGDLLFYKPYNSTLASRAEIIESTDAWKTLSESFLRMQHLKEQYGFNLYVINVPTKAQVYSNLSEEEAVQAFSSLLEEMSVAHDFGYVDIVQKMRDFVREQPDALLYWRDDTHWNELGNSFVANTLVEEVHFDRM